jgi:hypothetical protein
VGRGLSRLYVEAMMPAILGHRDVVFDRCWLSEYPYGQVLRGGDNRVGVANSRLLERLAMRCETTVVLAMPPLDVVVSNFLSRKEEELPQHVDQITEIYRLYKEDSSTATDLPVTLHDYTDPEKAINAFDLNELVVRTAPHPLRWRTAGNLAAEIVLVGDEFTNHTDHDPLYQWPFGSQSGAGCSRWLADQLEEGSFREFDLFWVNSADLTTEIAGFIRQKSCVVALGSRALDRLKSAGVKPTEHFIHPQGWKRFHAAEPYALINFLKGAVRQGNLARGIF